MAKYAKTPGEDQLKLRWFALGAAYASRHVRTVVASMYSGIFTKDEQTMLAALVDPSLMPDAKKAAGVPADTRDSVTELILDKLTEAAAKAKHEAFANECALQAKAMSSKDFLVWLKDHGIVKDGA